MKQSHSHDKWQHLTYFRFAEIRHVAFDVSSRQTPAVVCVSSGVHICISIEPQGTKHTDTWFYYIHVCPVIQYNTLQCIVCMSYKGAFSVKRLLTISHHKMPIDFRNATQMKSIYFKTSANQHYRDCRFSGKAPKSPIIIQLFYLPNSGEI